MHLFAVYIGGLMAGANIEVHDMRFVLAEKIEHAYATLRREWWGTPQSLHLDAWSALTQADGYRIALADTPGTGPEKLYYINLGGYDGQEFTELHKNLFLVATSEAQAKARAVRLMKHWQGVHKDNLYDVDQVIALDHLVERQSRYLHLTKIDDTSPAPVTCEYRRIGRKSAA